MLRIQIQISIAARIPNVQKGDTKIPGGPGYDPLSRSIARIRISIKMREIHMIVFLTYSQCVLQQEMDMCI